MVSTRKVLHGLAGIPNPLPATLSAVGLTKSVEHTGITIATLSANLACPRPITPSQVVSQVV